MKRIVLTGGGTAGHVTPNIALLPFLREADYDIHYIGSFEGIESRLIPDFDVPYYGISTGKFRRYFDLKNFSDPFRVMKGYLDAKKILKELKPDVVFSKGGFVAVPVVKAPADLKIPCIIHESHMSPGLANKICIPLSKKVCCNFPETLKNLPTGKAILTGTPIRSELTKGNRIHALDLCGFTPDKPVVMVVGGSQGSAGINQVVREALPKILEKFQVIHICGKDKVDNLMLSIPGYKQFEYVKTELKDLFALADLVVSRAGANAICELLALKKPNVLIPLSAGSRGDQILNAASFEEQGFSIVIREEALDCFSLVEKINELYDTKETYISKMNESGQTDAIPKIMELINEAANN